MLSVYRRTFPLAARFLSCGKDDSVGNVNTISDTIRFKPGAPTPGGADINIKLDVALVRLFFIGSQAFVLISTLELSHFPLPSQWCFLRTSDCPSSPPDLEWRAEGFRPIARR